MSETSETRPPYSQPPEEFHWAVTYLREDIQDIRNEIRGVHGRIDETNRSLSGRIDETNRSLSGRIDETNRSLSGRIERKIRTPGQTPRYPLCPDDDHYGGPGWGHCGRGQTLSF